MSDSDNTGRVKGSIKDRINNEFIKGHLAMSFFKFMRWESTKV